MDKEDLVEDLREFIDRQIRNIYKDNISSNYVLIDKIKKYTYNQFCAQLNTEQCRSCDKLTDLVLNSEIIANEEFYKQGLRDGLIMLLNLEGSLF